MSKKYYVVAYLDDAGIERVAPKTLTVSYGDKVIWANNLGEDYTAQDFQGPAGQLFPDKSYPMPPNGASNSAQVQVSQVGKTTYTYNCVNGLGEMLDPVIIVDNPGTGDGDGNSKRTKPKNTAQKAKVPKSKKQKSKKRH
ncbi:MAG: hypothetical protein LAP21_17695 [Acidobacteriia bacterium]|nr:hypothetical protein [Terriglobia bacterium]